MDPGWHAPRNLTQAGGMTQPGGPAPDPQSAQGSHALHASDPEAARGSHALHASDPEAGQGSHALHAAVDHDDHDDHDDDHGPAEDPKWVLLPLVIGLVIGLVLAIVFGLGSSVRALG